MIALCAGLCSDSTSHMGVRYDPKVAPRKGWLCPHCGGELRARPTGHSVGVVISADRRGRCPDVYYRVERWNARKGEWRRISPEGHGGLEPCLVRFACELEKLKRGHIRVIGSDGTVVREHSTPGLAA